MLRIEVVTPDCAEGEACIHEIPGGSPWGDGMTKWGEIMTAIGILYPDATSVSISTVEKE